MSRINIPSSIFEIYNDAVTLFERTITLYFPHLSLECPNCYENAMRPGLQSMSYYKEGGPIPFVDGMPCPYCGGRGTVETEESLDIPARIYWKKSDFVNVGPSIQIPGNTIQTIAHMEHLADIERASHMVPSYDGIENFKVMRFYKITPSYPQGFKQNPQKYVVSLWARNEN